MKPSAPEKSAKFVDDFEAVLLILKGVNIDFSAKKFLFFSLFNFCLLSQSPEFARAGVEQSARAGVKRSWFKYAPERRNDLQTWRGEFWR